MGDNKGLQQQLMKEKTEVELYEIGKFLIFLESIVFCRCCHICHHKFISSGNGGATKPELVSVVLLGLVFGFLSRVSIPLLTRDIDIVILSVCLSVRLSVCP